VAMKIHYLQTGTVQIKTRHQRARYQTRPARAFDVLTDRHWTTRLRIGCWLIEHPEGLVLVDTGETSHANDPGYQPWWHPFMQTCERRWVKPEEEASAQVRALGFDLRDVRWVVMTHMHGDHAGGIPGFPHSEFVLSAEQAKEAMAWSGPVNGFLNMHYPAWFSPKVARYGGPWESFDRCSVLTNDRRIRLVPTPGHVDGHQSVVVEQDDHLVFIGGDAAYDEGALLSGTVDGVAPSYSEHRDSTRRIRELCQRHSVITQFAHDARSAARLANKSFTVVRA
jgi:N-acyl homoserine lactone hydrolase